MRILPGAAAPLAFGLALLAAAPAWADRIPSRKVEIDPQHGVRPDIRVPYITNSDGNLVLSCTAGPSSST